ncbi:MAG: hypothetical protein IKC91_00015 [Clostridia bacterium]|nr:hypothetical protein [Clostridia bacterium]
MISSHVRYDHFDISPRINLGLRATALVFSQTILANNGNLVNCFALA